MATTKIVKTLNFPNSEDSYQINAVKLEGKSVEEIKKSVSTDDLQIGSDILIFDCGTSTKNI